MSYDLEVITVEKPAVADLEGAIGKEVLLAQKGGNYAVVEADGRLLLTIDGPHRVEPSDVSMEVATALGKPKWQLQISVGKGSPGEELARELATRVAQERNGCVWDPQAGGIIWPGSKSVRGGAPSKETRMDLLHLDWFLPPTVAREGDARTLLKTLKEHSVQALPSRFGPYEPLQGRWEREGEEGFVGAWVEAAVKNDAGEQIGGELFWKGKAPYWGGDVSFADRRNVEGDHYRPRGSVARTRLGLTVDVGALRADSALIELAVQLFHKMATAMKAFYGAAYVERGWIVKRGSLVADKRTEHISLQRSQFWLGLPARSTWLTWLGGPYVRLVDSVPSGVKEAGGWLVRGSGEPWTVDKSRVPVPDDLVAVDVDGEVRPALRIPRIEG